MKLARRELLVDLAWFAGLSLALGLLVAGTLRRLESAERQTDQLEAEVREKLARLRQSASTTEDPAELVRTEAALLEWHELTASEAQRIAALSAAASAAEVTLLALVNLEPTTSADGRVVAASHRLRSSGDYRQLARFFDEIQSAPGLAALEEVELEPGSDASSGLLEAELLVTWYSAAPETPAEERSGP